MSQTTAALTQTGKKSDEIPDKGAEFNASRNLLWIFFYLSHGRNNSVVRQG